MAKGKKSGFWDKQYKSPTHLVLSKEPAEDLEKFCRFLQRNHGRALLNVTTAAVDIGCGNGRNILYLSRTYGMRGVGYDISKEAIFQAVQAAKAENLPLTFSVQDLRKPIPLPESSVTIALDMMSSHILKRAEREILRTEILRVLKPHGWLFFKSFILEEDKNAARMLREFPTDEPGMYIHPEIGTAEYVWTIPEIKEFFGDDFIIHKIEKSFKHKHADGRAWKRRTASVYLEKKN
ncbi:MAG: class I SAM-dependent methyltransferase [Patescibacteria group bacterium]